MKATDIRTKTKQEILEELQGVQRELFNLRFQWQTEELHSPAQYRNLRRDIAKLKTILREMELGVNSHLIQPSEPGLASEEAAEEEGASEAVEAAVGSET